VGNLVYLNPYPASHKEREHAKEKRASAHQQQSLSIPRYLSSHPQGALNTPVSGCQPATLRQPTPSLPTPQNGTQRLRKTKQEERGIPQHSALAVERGARKGRTHKEEPVES